MAERVLHCTVQEARSRLTVRALAYWVAYFRLKADEEKKAVEAARREAQHNGR